MGVGTVLRNRRKQRNGRNTAKLIDFRAEELQIRCRLLTKRHSEGPLDKYHRTPKFIETTMNSMLVTCFYILTPIKKLRLIFYSSHKRYGVFDIFISAYSLSLLNFTSLLKAIGLFIIPSVSKTLNKKINTGKSYIRDSPKSLLFQAIKNQT